MINRFGENVSFSNNPHKRDVHVHIHVVGVTNNLHGLTPSSSNIILTLSNLRSLISLCCESDMQALIEWDELITDVATYKEIHNVT